MYNDCNENQVYLDTLDLSPRITPGLHHSPQLNPTLTPPSCFCTEKPRIVCSSKSPHIMNSDSLKLLVSRVNNPPAYNKSTMEFTNHINNNRTFCPFKLKFWTSGQLSGQESYVLAPDHRKKPPIDSVIKTEPLTLRVNCRGSCCHIQI